MLELTALCFLCADIEESDTRLSKPHHSARIEAAHVCKLEKILGRTLGICAAVDEHYAVFAAGQHRCHGSAANTLDAFDDKRSSGEQSAGRAGGHHCVALAVFEHGKRDGHGCILFAARCGARVILHCNNVPCIDDLDIAPVLAEIFFYLFLAADEHKLDSEPVARIDRAFDYGFGRVIAAHCVNYYFHSRRPPFS